MQNKIQIEVLVESSKNCSHSRIVASPYYGMKILVAAASDRANMVYHVWHLPIFCIVSCLHICYLNSGGFRGGGGGGGWGSEPPQPQQYNHTKLNSRCSCEDAQQTNIILIKGALSSV